MGSNFLYTHSMLLFDTRTTRTQLPWQSKNKNDNNNVKKIVTITVQKIRNHHIQ